MRARFVNEEQQLIQEFLLLKESNENGIIQKIKSAISKGVKMSVIIAALIGAGYTPAQAQTKVQQATEIVDTKSNLQEIIREIKRKGFASASKENKNRIKNLENKEVTYKKFTAASFDQIKTQIKQFLMATGIDEENTLIYGINNPSKVTVLLVHINNQ